MSPIGANWKPILFLVVVSPMVEFLTGSTSFAAIVSNLPVSILPFVVLTWPDYAFPVLLIRDGLVRGRKGLPSLLALGIAYGALNEGLLAKTYLTINPLSPVLGNGVGRFGGINWPWVTGITLFHMTISMGAPIAISFLVFPDATSRPLLADRTARWLLGLLVLQVVAIATLEGLFSSTLRAALPLLLLPTGIIAVGIYVARRLPVPPPDHRIRGRLRKPFPLAIAAMLVFIAMFVPILRFFPIPGDPTPILYELFYTRVPEAGVVATIYPVVLVVGIIWLLTRYSVTRRQLLAITVGVLAIPIATALSIHDIPVGQPFAAGVYLVAVVLAWRRSRSTGDEVFHLGPEESAASASVAGS